jgi:transposase InsO family protein
VRSRLGSLLRSLGTPSLTSLSKSQKWSNTTKVLQNLVEGQHASGPLQLVHIDLCGPISSPSFSGCKYILTFIDDFSIHTWVYFLKLKSEVFDKILAYKALVKKQSGHQIQKLRTDNGGEYVNNTFTSYYTTQGIQMQHIVPYTPQQNGVVERKNRTLKEMANCMIQSNGLSLKYWVKAIN